MNTNNENVNPNTNVADFFSRHLKEKLPSLGLDLYHLEWKPQASELVVFIINPNTNTATLDECVLVDRMLSPLFEETEWIPSDIVLEVSSPGVYRDLVTIEHFRRVVGDEIKIVLYKPLSLDENPELPKAFTQNVVLKGKLAAVHDQVIDMNLRDKILHIQFENIKRANLEANIS